MKRTIGLLTSGAIALGLISIQCSSGSDDDTNTTAGTGVGGSPTNGGAKAVGGGGASAGLPGVSGGGAGTFGGSPAGGAPGGSGPAGAPNGGAKAGGAGTGGAPAGGTSGSGTGGTSGGGGASAGRSGSGTGGGASGAPSGGSGGGSAGGGSTSTVKFSDVATILGTNCGKAGCHNAGQNNHNVLANDSGLYMRLTTPMTVGECKQTTLVTANDADSFLAKIIQGAAMCAGRSSDVPKMPRGGSLSPMQVKTITDWIAGGAPGPQ